MIKDLGLKSEISSRQTAEVRSLGLNKLTMKTITSRLAYYQTRLDSNLGVCVTFGPCVCVCMCVPSAANELRVSRVQVWECLMYSGGGQLNLLFGIHVEFPNTT